MKESFTKKVISNFNISRSKVPGEFIRNYIKVKGVYARVNNNCGKLSSTKSKLILKSVNTLLKKDNGELESLLPIDIFQSGGGTSINIPVNELISKYSEYKLNPFDDVNMSQSSNDTFPSVSKITTYSQIEELIKTIEDSLVVYERLIKETKDIHKVGRTHMQDALEMSVADELSAHYEIVSKNIYHLKRIQKYCLELPLGATALGSMQNISKEIRKGIIKEISKEYGIDFKASKNYYESVSSSGDLLKVSSAIVCCASDLLKISKDIILLSSGPKAGLNEIILKESQKGSSIMPGKINPSIFEAVCMVCFKVIGNGLTIETANQNAQLQLQAFNPIIAYTLFENIEILTNGFKTFNQKGISNISFNREGIKRSLESSLVYATEYSEVLGYERVAELYKESLSKDIDLKELIRREVKKSEKEFK